MMRQSKKLVCLLLTLAVSVSLVQPALAAGITYMPDVSAEMSDASYWAALYDDAQEIILTPEEIEAFNAATPLQSSARAIPLPTSKLSPPCGVLRICRKFP